MNLIISAIAQGMLWSIVSLGLFISFRVLNVADMTTEGAYPLGAAVCVTLIQAGLNPFSVLIISIFAGMMAGAVTGFFITFCKIPSLLAGILTMTALLSVNLRVMKRPNLSLLNYDTIFDITVVTEVSKYLNIIFVAIIILVFLIAIIYWFFSTELGQALIATGDNKKMAVSMGISTDKMTVLGLMLSNGIIALAGAILSQNNGYADVNSGLGVIVIGLVAIIIGEIVFGKSTFLMRLVYTIFGAIIYRLLLLTVLKINFIDANDFKMISAMLIAILLSLPRVKLVLRARRN